MSRRPITSPLEYLQIARRRWIWIVAPAVLISGLVVAGARKLPKVYQSEALILVEPQKVPADFVKPTVSGNVSQRLESIEEQILSRTQLSQIVQKYGLYRGSSLSLDGQVAQLQNDIQVTPIFDPDQRPIQVTAFRITYQGSDPVLLQQVTRDLSALFISENLKVRAQQAQGTEAFIDSRLADADQQLQSVETQLRELKSTYMGSLPEQEGANLQVMGQLQSVTQADAEALAQAQQQKTYLTSLNQAVDGVASAYTSPAPPSAAEQALHKAQSDLAVAEQMYTPEHPDVIRLKAQVQALESQVKAPAPASPAPAKAKANSAGTPQLSPQVRGQIALLDEEIQQRTKNQAATQAKIAQMQARIERLPEVEEKLTNLTTAYNAAKANDDALRQKKDAASMAAAMEQQAEGEEFRIVDPASLPQNPISPNLGRIDAMGVLGGLLLGVGLAGVVEMRDPVIRSEADVLFYTQVPMLAVLPDIQPGRPRTSRKLRLTAGGRQ
ncbi:MAG TPA: hypothetical protein VIC54_05175 [Terriglobales bacterium]|jgi:polysaccharide chain length determinant protein (PEP-CTERM system associated)